MVYRHPEGPDGRYRLSFLDEEVKLLKTVAKQLGLMITRKEALATQLSLEGQLRHADRLAKIGQFAAGVAHELNEPLANILGFAQLAAKTTPAARPGRPGPGKYRQVLPARQGDHQKAAFVQPSDPLQMISVDLNRMVTESLYFTESSCASTALR